MFSIPKALQTTFIYGPIVYENLIPENHILYKINQVIDFSFVNEACSDLYSLTTGRPVKNTPEMMFRSSIVQYLNNFSDRPQVWQISLFFKEKIPSFYCKIPDFCQEKPFDSLQKFKWKSTKYPVFALKSANLLGQN